MNGNDAHTPPPTLDALALRTADGDDDAFEELHRRLGGGLRRFIGRRLSGASGEQIEELHQAAWIAVWKSLREGRFNPERAKITTFAYAVGYKMVLRHLREAKRDAGKGTLPDADFHPVLWDTDNPDELLHDCERVEAVRDCLQREGTPNSLTEQERAVVTGLTGEETERSLAARMEIAASTVHSRKISGLKKLGDCMKQKGFE